MHGHNVLILFRMTHDSFALTGWGFVFFATFTLAVLGRGRRSK